jgi:hypothetical protein
MGWKREKLGKGGKQIAIWRLDRGHVASSDGFGMDNATVNSDWLMAQSSLLENLCQLSTDISLRNTYI